MPRDTRRTFLTKSAAATGVVGLVSLAGCADEDPAGEEGTGEEGSANGGAAGDDPGGHSMTYAAGGSGSGTFAHGQMIQAMIRDHTDHDITTQETSGTEANVRLFSEDESIDFMGTSNYALNQALAQEEPFADRVIERLPHQGYTYGLTHTYFLGREDAGLETYRDMEGANVWPLWPGSTIRIPTELVLQEVGLWDEINVINISQGDVAGALEEGRVDAIAVYGSNYRNIVGWEQEVDARADLTALEMEDDIAESIQNMPVPGYEEIEAYGWEQDLGADTVKSWTMDWHVPFAEEVPDDFVYDLIMTLHENSEQALEIDNTTIDYSDPEGFAAAVTDGLMPELPVHSGAAEAYRELGVWDDDWVEG